MRRPAGRVVVLCLAGEMVLAASGQNRPPQTPPVFRTTTEYVVLDVIVTDKADRPITDLTAADFRVTERGRTQKITDFSFVSVPIVTREIDLDAKPTPSVDIAANGVSPIESRALVYVVDDTALRAEDIIPIKRALRELLSTLNSDDQVALTYVRRSDLGQDFTNESSRLIRAVNSVRTALGIAADERDLLDVLDNVVRTLSAAQHKRKAIVLVGARGCVPRAQVSVPNCEDVIKRATQAGVPVYTLDPRGLVDAESVYGIGAIANEGDRAALTGVIAIGRESMRTLAVATGGRAFIQSDLKRAVRELMTENGSYYLLGYYPQPFERDGRFHDVQVEVTRPGVRVRSRRGYMAPGTSARPMTPHRSMTASLGAGLPDPSLPIRAFVAPMTAGPRGARAAVTIEIMYPEPEGGFTGAFDDDVRVGILALDPDARIKSSFQRPVKFTGTWTSGATGRIVINEIIDLPSRPLTLRVGVTSRALKKTGTAHIAVAVPDFERDELTLTPIVLGLADEKPDAAVGLDRLRQLLPFQPTLARAFTADQSVRVFARARWKSQIQTVDSSTTVVGAPSFTPQRLTVPGTLLKGGHREATLDRHMSFAGMQSGSYVLRVEVWNVKGDRAHREIPIEVK